MHGVHPVRQLCLRVGLHLSLSSLRFEALMRPVVMPASVTSEAVFSMSILLGSVAWHLFYPIPIRVRSMTA